MFDWFRRWSYRKHEARIAASDDLAEFEKWFYGPWTPDMTSKMPWDVLMKGPSQGQIDSTTRRAIDLEVEKRMRSVQPSLANFIAVLALGVAVIALLKNQ